MFDEEDAVDEYDTHGYDYRSPDDEEVMPVSFFNTNEYRESRNEYYSDVRIRRLVYVIWIVSAVIGIALLGGGVYMVYKVLAFFGIL